jgi:elongation factor P
VTYENEVVGLDLPRSVELAVMETAPDARGNTASGGGKPAVLETGLTVSVPFFMKIGDVVKVDTRDGSYIERVSGA